MRKLLLLSGFLFSFVGVSSVSAQPQVLLEELPAAFVQPIDIKHAGDERLFVVEKAGRIWIMSKDGIKQDPVFLNITSIVNSNGSEQGLLGLAFHPDYANNGYFYVNYTGTGGHTRISRFSVSPGNPDVALPASEKILMIVNQPFGNHNAGDLAFGPDGYLYITMGDGGSGNDPGNRSQNPQELLGKMLRIDVDNGDPYGIPMSNPFAGSTDTLPEIWALGLRNPWRVSFDRMTGDFWIADVGQSAWEEINMEPAGSPGGKNWGWRCYEGFAPHILGGCGPQGSYDFPIHVYQNVQGVDCSVTGGYVYRGNKHPSLFGKYIYADFCGGGRMWTLEPGPSGTWINTQVRQGAPTGYAAFGEDNEGEMYVATLSSGKIYRIAAPCSLTAEVETTDPSCAGYCDGMAIITPTGGCAPYTVEMTSPDGMVSVVTDTFFAEMCPGDYSYVIRDCNDCEFEGSFVLIDPPTLSMEMAITPVTCPGECDGTLTVSAMGGCEPYMYLVSTTTLTGLDSTYQGLCPDTYFVQVTDCNGCVIGSQFILTEPLVLSIFIFWDGDTLFANTGFEEYIWLRDGEEIARGVDHFIIPDSTGEYIAIGLDANACEFISNTVQIDISSLVTTLPGVNALYPNPFNNQLTLQLESEKSLQLSLLDLKGREVVTSLRVPGGTREIVWPLEGLASGVYFLVLREEGGFFGVQRLVKSN